MKKVYAIKDVKADCFLTPFTSENDATASRALGGIVNDRQSMFGQHPEDYVVYHVGSFDQTSGQLVGEDTPRYAFSCTQLVQVAAGGCAVNLSGTLPEGTADKIVGGKKDGHVSKSE